jgi:hypothetical protein
VDSLDDTRARGLENVLHLHGLEDSDRSALLDLGNDKE